MDPFQAARLAERVRIWWVQFASEVHRVAIIYASDVARSKRK